MFLEDLHNPLVKRVLIERGFDSEKLTHVLSLEEKLNATQHDRELLKEQISVLRSQPAPQVPPKTSAKEQ